MYYVVINKDFPKIKSNDKAGFLSSDMAQEEIIASVKDREDAIDSASDRSLLGISYASLDEAEVAVEKYKGKSLLLRIINSEGQAIALYINDDIGPFRVQPPSTESNISLKQLLTEIGEDLTSEKNNVDKVPSWYPFPHPKTFAWAKARIS